MLRIGLTGGIGSGKSTVAAHFARLGTPVIDTDEIARNLVMPEKPAYRYIVHHFGQEVVQADGHIDRARLRQIVFDDAEKRKTLEAILHPRIHAQLMARAAELRAPYCVFVIPLLIESRADYAIGRLLVVDVDEDVQLKRVVARGLSDDQARKMIAAQASRAERLQRADDVIENRSSIADLEAQVGKLHEKYLALAHVA